MVLGVVPGEEDVAVGAGVLDRAEARREVRPVLQRLELRLGERVVVGDVRPAVGLGDAQVGQQQRHGLGGHRRAAIGVDGQLLAADALPGTGLADELLGQRGAFAMGHHPADHVAAEHVEHHVEVEVGPLRRAQQLGDVPAPQLVGPAGQQLRGGVGGMPELIAPLPHLRVRGQEAIHRALGAEVVPFVEQRGVDLGGRAGPRSAARASTSSTVACSPALRARGERALAPAGLSGAVAGGNRWPGAAPAPRTWARCRAAVRSG